MKRLKWTLGILILGLTATRLGADTFFPMLMYVSPIAVQQGTTTEVEVVARYDLSGTYRVFVTGDGVKAEPIGAEEAKPAGKAKARTPSSKLKVRFTVTPNAMPGPREVRLATPRGVSTVAQVVVVKDPIIREAANNDSLQTAQAITLPATVCGAFEKAEDVDFYKFKVAANTALTFHVRCQRLQHKIHDLQELADPILTLRNSAGTVLAVNDNYFFGDPLLVYRFPIAGDYFLEIRDVRYLGNVNWHYCIEINDRPFVTGIFPSRVLPGKATKVQLIGHHLPADATATLTMPAETPDGLHWTVLTLPSGQTNAIPVIVDRLPEVIESAENNDTPATAQKITVPCGISGRIEKEGDIDCFRFSAKAGEKFTFQVIARDHQSQLDSLLRILNAKGDRLVENDDQRGRFVHADSKIENWAAPAAGEYIVEIRDVHLRGGPEFFYFLKITRSEPHFELEIDSDKALVSPGTNAAIFVRAIRKNGFAGEVLLSVEGLPQGVTANCGRILEEGRDGCIILQGTPGAKPAAENARVLGVGQHKTADGKMVEVKAVAQPLQEIYMPGGGRYHYPVETHTVSISEPLDLRSLKISPAAITLKPGESKRVEVAIERAEGFKSNVSLDAVYQHLSSIYGNSLPPGVTIDEKNSQTLLNGTQIKGHVTFQAAATAKPVEKQMVPIMAHVSMNFVVKFSYASEPLFITIAKP